MATISNEIKCYFEKLIEPLKTNKSLEDLFDKLKDDVLKKKDERITGQNVKGTLMQILKFLHMSVFI